MTTPINLNKARKDRKRQQAKAEADSNAVKFGRTRAEKARDQADANQASRDLDHHRREE
ncbi:MAG: DUF4169 family protein [Silicimonas sp.]|nr:DUF4169 family protein [Silicimonas sp.]